MKISVGILTVSDRCYRGETEDESGPLLVRLVMEHLTVRIVEQAVVPDERRLISEALQRWCDDLQLDLILTTGGTGFAASDVTPEATKDVIDRDVPGLVEAMRAAGVERTPHAMLSRAIAGICRSTLVVNLPGSPKGAKESFEVILPALPHGIEILRGSPGADRRHQHPAAA